MKRLDDHTLFSVGSSLENGYSDNVHAALPPPRYKIAIVVTGGMFVSVNSLGRSWLPILENNFRQVFLAG